MVFRVSSLLVVLCPSLLRLSFAKRESRPCSHPTVSLHPAEIYSRPRPLVSRPYLRSNMKFAMNGALIIGTMDGANIEICEEIDEDNMFVFGTRTPDVPAARRRQRSSSSLIAMRRRGKSQTGKCVLLAVRAGLHVAVIPSPFREPDYQIDPNLREAIAAVQEGMFGDAPFFAPVLDPILSGNDYYLINADFPLYLECQVNRKPRTLSEEKRTRAQPSYSGTHGGSLCLVQKLVDTTYKNRTLWIRKSVYSTARMGKFSSDRSIAEYASEVWHVTPAPCPYRTRQAAGIQSYQTSTFFGPTSF